MTYCQSISQILRIIYYLDQMYPTKLKIKDATHSNVSASYLDLLLSIWRDGQLHTSLYDKRDDFNFHITNFPFLSSWTIFHLRQPMVRLSHISYGMSGLAPLKNVLFWERRDFHVSFSGRDMSRTVWNRLSVSSSVDMGISSNIMKFPSTKYYMTFFDMIIYSDTLHWSDMSLNCDLVTELDLIAVFDVIALIREVSIGHLQRMRLASRKRLLLRTPDHVPFRTCICSNV